MTTPLPSARHNNALNSTTGIRRVTQITLSRAGVSMDVEPTSASFTQDARRSQRWAGSLTFSDPALLPTGPDDLLTPFGTRVAVSLGVELADGTRSVVPYGRYMIGSATADVDADSSVTKVTLVDMADVPERYRFEEPLPVAAGTDLADMINAVIASRTGTNPTLTATGRTLGAPRTFGLSAETGPWSEVLSILDAFDMTAWYDRSGSLGLGGVSQDPSLAKPISGELSLSVKFDTRPYNVIVVRGEPADAEPIQVVAYDDDPSSPTYAGTTVGSSDYGRVTRFYSSKMIYTEAQAADTAVALLATSLGAGASMTMVRSFDPTADVNDIISVAGKNYIVDSVSLNVTGTTSQALRPL